MLPLAVQAAMAAIEKICPEAKKPAADSENHTRNTFYLSNVARLVQIFSLAGLNVRLGTWTKPSPSPPIAPGRWQYLTVEPLITDQAPPGLEAFRPLHHFAEQRPVGRDS